MLQGEAHEEARETIRGRSSSTRVRYASGEETEGTNAGILSCSRVSTGIHKHSQAFTGVHRHSAPAALAS